MGEGESLREVAVRILLIGALPGGYGWLPEPTILESPLCKEQAIRPRYLP